MARKDNILGLFQKTSSGENPLIGDPRYEKVRALGRGAYGFVQLAIDKRTKEKVAIKFWPRDPDVITVDVQRELHNHSSFKHPNVIQFREVFLTQTHLGLAMEPAHGGDLFKRVSSRGLSEIEARVVFQQLLLAVDYCHKMGVANRDIKLENVLLADRKSPPTIKLTDFGFCKSERDSVPTTMCGTLGYMAPEVIWGEGSAYDGRVADVWSCGIMLFVMLFSQYPFADKHAVLRGIQFPEKPQVSASVKDLILRMVERSPHARIRLADVCSHPWVAQGLPMDYLSQNDQYIRAAEDNPPKQSIEEIDRLLLEAGLQLEDPEEEHLDIAKLVLDNGKHISGDVLEW